MIAYCGFKGNRLAEADQQRHKPYYPSKGSDMTVNDAAWPTELKVAADRKSLKVVFEDGREFSLPAEILRVNSPSAEVQGHGPGQKVTVAGKAGVHILDLRPVGNYAVRIVFDDGHDSGLFTWGQLSQTGDNLEKYWQDYIDDLAEKGLSREP